MCVRGEWRQGQTAILNQQYFFLILAGLLNRGSLRAHTPLSAAGSQFGILSPTDSNCLSPGYIIFSRPLAPAVLLLIYTGASLDWRLGRRSICYTMSQLNTFVTMARGFPRDQSGKGFSLSLSPSYIYTPTYIYIYINVCVYMYVYISYHIFTDDSRHYRQNYYQSHVACS